MHGEVGEEKFDIDRRINLQPKNFARSHNFITFASAIRIYVGEVIL